MLRIAICDDDRPFAAKLEGMVRREAKRMGLAVETEVYFDGDTLVADMTRGYGYELVFLDIEMEHMNGIHAAHEIRRIDRLVLLIYVSAHEQYLKELFEVEPFRFLPKPVEEERFCRYFREACQRTGETDAVYQYMYNKQICRVALREIVYFESRNRQVYLHLDDGTEECFYGKLNDVEKELEGSGRRFIRIHQSYLVNYSYIKRMSFTDITLVRSGGRETNLRISEDRAKKVRMLLCTIASGKAGVV